MFKSARIEAGMSTEKASWALHIGRRTLINYEGGKSPVPPEVVIKMEKIYNQPNLAAIYCSDYCPIGQKYAHRVEDKDFPTAVMGVLKGHNDVKSIKDRLVEIAADGTVQEDEKTDLGNILRELLQLEKAIGTLKLTVSSLIPMDTMMQELKKEKTAFAAAK